MAIVQERRGLDRSQEARQAVWARRVGSRKNRAWRRRLLNAFIVWHCFAVAVWLLPPRFPFVRDFLPPDNGGLVRLYLVTTNFLQNWQMFSPNPDDTDRMMTARIRYANGTTRDWTFPRMATMGYVERYRRERMRKWIEVAGHNDIVWPCMARYAARLNNVDPHNPPVAVTIIESARHIPPPGGRATPFESHPVCEMPITAEVLR